MKKLILSVLMGACMAAGLSAKTAVVYFSATGTTERMAKNAASAMGADIFEIEPAHKYTAADLNGLSKTIRRRMRYYCNSTEFLKELARPRNAKNTGIPHLNYKVIIYNNLYVLCFVFYFIASYYYIMA